MENTESRFDALLEAMLKGEAPSAEKKRNQHAKQAQKPETSK